MTLSIIAKARKAEFLAILCRKRDTIGCAIRYDRPRRFKRGIELKSNGEHTLCVIRRFVLDAARFVPSSKMHPEAIFADERGWKFTNCNFDNDWLS